MKSLKTLSLIALGFGAVFSVSAEEYKFDNIKIDHAKKEQNAFEAFDGFVSSLESPTSNVIGADGNTDANDDDMLGTNFQELI